jgi:hypothetical protein
MADNGKLKWELLGFGLIVGGPAIGAVIVSNKSPAVWLAVWGAAAKLLKL